MSIYILYNFIFLLFIPHKNSCVVIGNGSGFFGSALYGRGRSPCPLRGYALREVPFYCSRVVYQCDKQTGEKSPAFAVPPLFYSVPRTGSAASALPSLCSLFVRGGQRSAFPTFSGVSLRLLYASMPVFSLFSPASPPCEACYSPVLQTALLSLFAVLPPRFGVRSGFRWGISPPAGAVRLSGFIRHGAGVLCFVSLRFFGGSALFAPSFPRASDRSK